MTTLMANSTSTLPPSTVATFCRSAGDGDGEAYDELGTEDSGETKGSADDALEADDGDAAGDNNEEDDEKAAAVAVATAGTETSNSDWTSATRLTKLGEGM